MHKRSHLYRHRFYTFDIETTTIVTGTDKNGDPLLNGIIWSGQFYDGVDYIQVRSLHEVIKRLKLIEDEAKDLGGDKICIFVHFLSYEFQFIKDYFTWEQILCTKQRQIISAETEYLVFRCSNKLSNQKLEKFLKNENVPKEYQKTNMDYLVERYPWTPITEEEYTYCKNDVVGLHLAMQRRISKCAKQDINFLPLTSTGYVRKVCRTAFNEAKGNRARFKRDALDLETYNMNHIAFRGGNTHANKAFANKVVKNVGQKDVRSEYPTMLFKKYPTKFFDLKPFKQKEFDYYLNHSDDWALLFEICFIDLHLKDPDRTPVPYISISKCNPIKFRYNHKSQKDKHALEVDNGRIISCAGATTIITEVDYKIIRGQYDWDEELTKITKVKVAKKKQIPKQIRDKILEFYYNKTTLKQDEDDPDFDEDIAYNYARSKELLNGIYGCHVSAIIRPEFKINNHDYSIHIKYKGDEEFTEVLPHSIYIDPDTDEQQQLIDYYNNFSSFLEYQVGIWCTCYAREWLQRGISACERTITDENGNEKIVSDLVYCDTDSCKYLNPKLHEPTFEALNKEMEDWAEKVGAFIDYNDKRYYLGIWCDEGVAKLFKTWGAKKYMASTPDGFKITISGVPKKEGKKCIIDAIKAGKLKHPFDVKKGFVFRAVKNASQYNDLPEERSIEIDGHTVYYSSNIAMYPTSYSLGMTYEYEVLLSKYKEYMFE